MTFLIPCVLIALAFVLASWLAERDHQERRRDMGLRPSSSPWSEYLAECSRRRARCEARLGISPHR